MKCPNCQMNIKDNSRVCIHCGTQFLSQPNPNLMGTMNPQYMNTNVVQNQYQSVPQNVTPTYSNNSHPVLTIIAIMIGVIVLGGAIYIIALPKQIQKGISESTEESNFENDTGSGTEKKLLNKTVYKTNDIIVTVPRVLYNQGRIMVYFDLENKSDKYYNLQVSDVLVDGKSVPYSANSDLGTINGWVEPNNHKTNYIIYLLIDDLKNENINYRNIKVLSFQLRINYSLSSGVTYETFVPDGYCEIQFKR